MDMMAKNHRWGMKNVVYVIPIVAHNRAIHVDNINFHLFPVHYRNTF